MTVIGLMAAPKIHLKSVRSMQRNTPGLLDRRIGPKDMFIVLLYIYSLYEPKDIVLSEYKGGLEKAILKNSTLLVQLNDAFCKTAPMVSTKGVYQFCTCSHRSIWSTSSQETK
ncbi:hypothetical protein EMCRGX_G023142 [Ephydatia muelleri]